MAYCLFCYVSQLALAMCMVKRIKWVLEFLLYTVSPPVRACRQMRHPALMLEQSYLLWEGPVFNSFSVA
jgi:hypothetical protein